MQCVGIRVWERLGRGLVGCLWLWSVALGAEPVVAQLTFAPAVPAPSARRQPAQVVVNLATEEKVMDLSDGIQYEFWTYNGHVPGPFIRLRQGDTFEVHLDNSKGKLTHTVDFHAVTGPGGGAGVGFFVYHCAGNPIPSHIANGLYGVILVEPPQGLAKVNREYYVMQSEFYTSGAR